jgi:hypothetical protein
VRDSYLFIDKYDAELAVNTQDSAIQEGKNSDVENATAFTNSSAMSEDN